MTARWDMIGKPISTADMAAAIPTVFQQFQLPVTFPQSLLQGVGMGIIFLNPAFTDLAVEIWSDRAGNPSALLATSQTKWTKAQIDAQFPLSFKAAHVGFQFTPFPLRRGTFYHFVLRATGYTGDAAGHIAWRRAFPDPQYPISPAFDAGANNVARHPYEACLFTSED